MGKKWFLFLILTPTPAPRCSENIPRNGITCSLHDLFLAQEDAWPVIWPDLIHVQALPGIDVAPGSIRLSELEVDFRERQAKGSVLLRSLTHVRVGTLHNSGLSTPVGILLVNALVAADLLIIPIQTDFLALHGLKLLFDTLHTLNKALGRPVRYRAVPTMYDRRAKACTRVLELMRRKMGQSMFSTVIGVDTHFREASAQGCTIYDIDARSKGALGYNSLAEEVVKLW